MKILALIFFALSYQITPAQTLPKRPKIEDVRSYNQARLMHIDIGMSKQQVLDTMGGMRIITVFDPTRPLGSKKTGGISNPYSRDMKKDSAGNTIEILWYYTDLKSGDMAITKNELTPVVLENNSVAGIGWGFFEDYAKRKEIFLDITNH